MKNKNKQTPQDIYAWCCDYENYRGEGRLARCFVEHVIKKKKINFYIKTPYYFCRVNKKNLNTNIIKIKKKINLSLANKYVAPFMGILWLWKNFFLRRKIAYINFNPLWNIFLFILCPPGTIFGPITGSVYDGNITNFNKFIRAFLFPFLFRISFFFLNIRKNKILFSTSLLKKIVPNFFFDKCIFDFQIIYYTSLIKNKKKIIKNIDLIYYNRVHDQKKNLPTYKILKLLSNLDKYKKIVIGNNLPLKSYSNLKIVEHKKLLILLSRSKYTFFSPENHLSMFLLEALSANTKIFIDNKNKEILNYFEKNNFIFLDFSNEEILLKKIMFYLHFDFKMNKTKLKKNILNNLNNEINHYLDEF